MAEHSPQDYLNSNFNRGSSCSILKRKVAVPYDVMREASVFIAAVAANSGIGSVTGYMPLLHTALIGLGCFGTAIMIAPAVPPPYDARRWPNVELRAFADSIVDLGVNMKFHTPAIGRDGMPAATVHNTGAALKQMGLSLATMAGNTDFCQHDLSHVVAASMPSFRLSEAIANGLIVDALAHALTPGTVPGSLEHLTMLIGSYNSNNNPHQTMSQRLRRK